MLVADLIVRFRALRPSRSDDLAAVGEAVDVGQRLLEALLNSVGLGPPCILGDGDGAGVAVVGDLEMPVIVVGSFRSQDSALAAEST